jgi:RNA polymerase sigma-70 factor, ECF subfamily
MDTCIRSLPESHDPPLSHPSLVALAAGILALILGLLSRSAPPLFAESACANRAISAPEAELPAALLFASERRARSGHRPASTRGRTWRRTFRPVLGARRLLAARRRSQGGPPGAPPGRLPEGAREPTREERKWLEGETARLVRLARRMGVRSSDADDVAQEAVKLALEAWGTWPTARDMPYATLLRRWLTGFLFRSAARDRYRTEHEHAGRLDVAGVMRVKLSVSSFEGSTTARWTLQSLQTETSPENWRAWVARYVDGLPVSQIAHNEGTPKATIYNRIRLARRDFRSARRREEARADGPMVARPRSRGRK